MKEQILLNDYYQVRSEAESLAAQIKCECEPNPKSVRQFAEVWDRVGCIYIDLGIALYVRHRAYWKAPQQQAEESVAAFLHEKFWSGRLFSFLGEIRTHTTIDGHAIAGGSFLLLVRKSHRQADIEKLVSALRDHDAVCVDLTTDKDCFKKTVGPTIKIDVKPDLRCAKNLIKSLKHFEIDRRRKDKSISGDIDPTDGSFTSAPLEDPVMGDQKIDALREVLHLAKARGNWEGNKHNYFGWLILEIEIKNTKAFKNHERPSGSLLGEDFEKESMFSKGFLENDNIEDVTVGMIVKHIFHKLPNEVITIKDIANAYNELSSIPIKSTNCRTCLNESRNRLKEAIPDMIFPTYFWRYLNY